MTGDEGAVDGDDDDGDKLNSLATGFKRLGGMFGLKNTASPGTPDEAFTGIPLAYNSSVLIV